MINCRGQQFARWFTGAVILSLLSGVSLADDERARAAYEILKENCIDCHGESPKAGLDLRTVQSLRAGGENGPVIVPHQPPKSRLYLLVSHAEQPAMPRKKPKLPEADLETLRLWIEDGGSLEGVEEAAGDADGKRSNTLAIIPERGITAAERNFWAFRPPQRTQPPRPAEPDWNRNPVDAFLLATLNAKGLKPSPPAARPTLIRRAYLDVLGLPPSPEEVEAFARDSSPGAWERLVDRLLASPHYGERWARHWLDLARYADSGGFEFDVDRPEAWRYRDYVVNSFNADKPYDQFIREQIAGDEFAPDSDEAAIATGFLRLGPQSGGGSERGRQESLDDIIGTTTLTFMGLTVSCARCHDHKFDPIPQKDYYRLQAVFYNTRGAERPLVPADVVSAQRAETSRIESQQRPLQREKTRLEAPYLKRLTDDAIAELPEYLQVAWRTPEAERTEGQRLNVAQIRRTLQNDTLRKKITEQDLVALMSDEERRQHHELKDKIGALDAKKPKPYPTALAISESGREPRTSYFLHRGSVDAKGPPVTPGMLAVIGEAEYDFPPPPADARSSWRRRAFANWLVSPGNPLTARVMVNRIWQHNFGEGIVRTPSNFGQLGERPTHPELLDWLALEFIARGWSLKAIHRLIMTSQAYQMASDDIPANLAIDSENRFFWRMPRQRLEAEIIRDQILALSGRLDRTLGGPNVFPYINPELFEASSKRNWPGRPDDDPSTWRRSLYVFSKRSIRYPLFESFDQPNLINSNDRRNRSTIAPQALLLMNTSFVITQAGYFAERLQREAGKDVLAQVNHAYRLALGRAPDKSELAKSVAYVRGNPNGLSEFCHVLFNLNEFVYRQ
jgi:mono/diheme cytochrome c family protein/cytochrome c553